jgi:hypothetical protein
VRRLRQGVQNKTAVAGAFKNTQKGRRVRVNCCDGFDKLSLQASMLLFYHPQDIDYSLLRCVFINCIPMKLLRLIKFIIIITTLHTGPQMPKY